MKRAALAIAVLSGAALFAASHSVTFGKVLAVKWFVTPERSEPLKVRPLYADAKLREFTTGETHAITENTFAVRQAYRINDALPDDSAKAPDWKWQRGGWLLVDRERGRVSNLNLPDFDPFYSVVNWYRDYAAYCGISETSGRVLALVTQVGRRKPLVRKELGDARDSSEPDSICAAPRWQRDPARVTFSPAGGAAITVDVHGRSVATPAGDEKEE